MELGELFKRIDERKLVLPDFQRDLEWKKNQQRDLIASVLLGLPIGSILVLEGKADDFSAKRIGYSKQAETPAIECLYLLDGQQRITSLKSSFCDFFTGSDSEWRKTMDEVYPSLKNRLFLRVNVEEDEIDVFGYENLNFNEEFLRQQDPIYLQERLTHESIAKTGINRWWNPGAIFKDINFPKNSTNEQKRKKIIQEFRKKAAQECLLPLYCLYSDNESKNIYKILHSIAMMRAEELENEVENDEQQLVHYLKNIDPDIEDSLEEVNISNLWSRLAAQWAESVYTYLMKILTLEISMIRLKSNEIGRAVIIFENINRGGTKLNNFDLVVARAARDKGSKSLSIRLKDILGNPIDLPESLTVRIQLPKLRPTRLYISQMTVKDTKINDAIKNQYLNLLSIYCEDVENRGINFKPDILSRQRILALTHNEINDYTEIVMLGIKRACAFLNVRCGISDIGDLQYKLMLLPLSLALIDDEIWNSEIYLNKLEAWYWISIFSGQYSEKQNERCIRDINQIRMYLYSDTKIYSQYVREIFNVPKYCTREILLCQHEESIPKAIDNVFLQYILSNCPPDFCDEEVYLTAWDITNEVISVEDHHIRPLNTATSLGQSSRDLRKRKKHCLNSPLNRTFILSTSNRLISDKSPERYFKELDYFNLNQHFIKEDDYSPTKHYKNDGEMYKAELEVRYERIVDKIKEEINALLN